MTRTNATATDGAIEPKFILTGADQGRIGSDRIKLLRAIRDQGSIAAAAKQIGISYKAAWDAVLAMNNLFPTPLVERQTGGSQGGGADLTEKGEAVLEAMEEAMTALDRFAKSLTGPGDERDGSSSPSSLWSLMMKTSARNAIQARITAIRPGAVNAEVDMDYGDGGHLTAIVTQDSVESLGLGLDSAVTVLIKSTFIILCPPDAAGGISARNKIKGVITQVIPGAVNTEIIMDIGAGKSLAAMVTEVSAKELGYKEGDEVVALIKASHVILAAA